MSVVPVKIAHAVDERDEQKCTRCGVWIEGNGSRHHRQRRAVGGHTLPNLILLCGSGTTGCHNWVHSNPALAKISGYIVATWVTDVSSVPVMVNVAGDLEGGHLEWMLLSAEGERVRIGTVDALERLASLGVTADALADALVVLRTMA